MQGKFSKALVQFHKGEKGITGLETAIILIAFVTVAAVLAYSVLSAGVFSSEKGQEAVMRGLEEAQASMQVVGSVYAEGTVDVVPANSSVDAVKFQLGTVLAGESVDLDYCVVNYQDADELDTDITTGGDDFGFNGTLGPNEVAEIDINVSTYDLAVYDYFTIEIIPQTGASLKFTKWIPGEIEEVMDLN